MRLGKIEEDLSLSHSLSPSPSTRRGSRRRFGGEERRKEARLLAETRGSPSFRRRGGEGGSRTFKNVPADWN